ncbi:MAG TPA: SWIM zinc finger family protein [Vicinamibacteria bacterium]|jgi:uncharacterized Zn finger protein
MPRDRDRPWWRDPEASGPREARGGIKAHSRRGSFGQSWWARRWLDVLERLELGGRLTRGRSYARRGQVLDIAIEEGRVKASVQGSRPDPYTVTVKIALLSAPAWRSVAQSLRQEARFVAKLLASEMPEDVEEAFKRAGVALFPARRAELVTECSCPDWSNPCKHIAAVYYLLGEEFDRDPFLIFQLRGLSRAEMVALLRSPRSEHAARPRLSTASAIPAEPLPADPAAFWSGGEIPPAPEVRVPDTTAALLRRLGPFSFWRGKRPMTAELDPLYGRAAARALDIFVGGRR